MLENSNATIWDLHISFFAGIILAEATLTTLLFTTLGGAGGGVAGFGAGLSVDKIVRKLWPVSGKKLDGWKLYLEEALTKMVEDNRKLINDEIEKFERLKRSELDNARSKIQREKDELNDEKHPLNQWSNELVRGREVAQSIRQENDKKLWCWGEMWEAIFFLVN